MIPVKKRGRERGIEKMQCRSQDMKRHIQPDSFFVQISWVVIYATELIVLHIFQVTYRVA